MKPIVGILGGMGPRATVQFEQLLLGRLPGSDQSLPTIITINDGSIPDRTDYLLHGGEDPLPALQRNLTKLESMGASIICVPCNTACVPKIFSRLQPKQSRILNLPEVVCSYIANQGLEKVYLLATDGTLAAGAYQRLCCHNGIVCEEPDQSTQQIVSAVIAAVKQGNMALAATLAIQVSKSIAQADSDGVILGCTELPLVSTSIVPPDCLAIDTLEILADTCIQELQTTKVKGRRHDPRRIYA